MLPIYNKEPSDWKDLQDKVAKIFSDIGYETQTEKTIALVRGSVEVDVFAKKNKARTEAIYVSECKFWSNPIPKQIVHAFRTIVSDYNIQAGYIISKVGFQKGAIEAAINTNVYLMTFEEFQEEFFEEWLSAVVDELNFLGQPLRKYADYMEDFYDDELAKIPEVNQKKFFELTKKHMWSSMISSHTNYKHLMTGKLEMEYIDATVDRYRKHIPKNIKIDSLMSYFDYAKKYSLEGLKEIDSLFDNPPRHWTSIDLEDSKKRSQI